MKFPNFQYFAPVEYYFDTISNIFLIFLCDCSCYYREDTISNGKADELSGLEANVADRRDEKIPPARFEDEEQVAMGDDEEERGDNGSDADKETADISGPERLATASRTLTGQWSWSKSARAPKRRRDKKAVQFADGVRPGEGTSPSGGEGDMPSPPPPVPALASDSIRDMTKRSRSRKSRKKQKRAKAPKTKKKVKVGRAFSKIQGSFFIFAHCVHR